MKRIAIAVSVAILAAPVLAQAKTGMEFDRLPDTAKPGQKITFTVMVMSDGPSSATPGRFRGRHPLITFRSQSGRIVRVRTGPADQNGIAHGSVAFPNRGPWSTEMSVGKVIRTRPENSEPIRVGVGLTQTTPPAAEPSRTSSPSSDGFPWLWVLSLGTIGSALLVLLMRRRGHWGAA